MKKAYWIGGGILVAGAAALIYSKVASTINAAKNLKFSPLWHGGINDMHISLSTVKLPLAVDIQNRSDQTISFNINSIDVYQNDVMIASSNVTGEKMTLKSYSTTRVPLDVEVSTTFLVQFIGLNVVDLIAGRFQFENLKLAFDNLSFRADLTVMGMQQPVVFDMDGNVKLDGGNFEGIPAEKRTISPLNDYISCLPSRSFLKNEELEIIKDTTAEDTAAFIRRKARQDAWQTAELSRALQGTTAIESIQNVFDFVYSHIKYEEDSKFCEQVRSPLRTLYDQKGDCDCYSLLIASIFTNLAIPFRVRIVKYRNRSYFQHVYIVAVLDGKEYACDPVTIACFREEPYTEKLDF